MDLMNMSLFRKKVCAFIPGFSFALGTAAVAPCNGAKLLSPFVHLLFET